MTSTSSSSISGSELLSVQKKFWTVFRSTNFYWIQWVTLSWRRFGKPWNLFLAWWWLVNLALRQSRKRPSGCMVHRALPDSNDVLMLGSCFFFQHRWALTILPEQFNFCFISPQSICQLMLQVVNMLSLSSLCPHWFFFTTLRIFHCTCRFTFCSSWNSK